MRAWPVVTAILFCSATASAGELVADGVPVSIDGKASRADVISVEGGLDVRPDDLIEVGGFVVTRGTEPALEFRTDAGRLWQTFADAKERLVAVVAAAPGDDPTDEKPARADTLSGLDDGELTQVRGVLVCGWSNAVEKELARVDPERTCFVVAAGVDAVPPLPRKARFVVLAASPAGSEGHAPRDLSSLAGLTELRVLDVGYAWSDADVSLFEELGELRHLDLHGRTAQHPEALAKLGSLRVLRAPKSRLSSAEGLRPLTHLVRVDLTGTAVSDLSPLSGHVELREIGADATSVGVLPRGSLPALREIRLRAACVSKREIAAFTEAYPACAIVRDWRPPLVEAARRAGRIRVRTGGTCHRGVEKERVLFDLPARSDVEELLGMLEFSEYGRGDRCMCCGEPTIELYEGERLVVELGGQHGGALRWLAGPWPGDATLTEKSARALAAWLAAHSTSEPKREAKAGPSYADSKVTDAEFAARDAEQDRWLSADRASALDAAADVTAAAKLWAQWFPDPAERLAILATLAARPALTRLPGPRDRIVTTTQHVLLEVEDAAAALAAVDSKLAAGGDGAKWAAGVVEKIRDGRFPGADLAALRVAAARILLAADEGVRAAELLGAAPCRQSDELLLSLLPPAGEDGRPLGSLDWKAQRAAFALAARCDPALLPRLREIPAAFEREHRMAGWLIDQFDEIVAKRPIVK